MATRKDSQVECQSLLATHNVLLIYILAPWIRLFKSTSVFIPETSTPCQANVDLRNTFMSEKGLPLPKATSTGTTIVGCLFKDGIVLGADTRATEGPIVADKNCEKVLQTRRLCLLPSV